MRLDVIKIIYMITYLVMGVGVWSLGLRKTLKLNRVITIMGVNSPATDGKEGKMNIDKE